MEKIGEIGIVGADKRGRNRTNQTDIGIIRREKEKDRVIFERSEQV